MGYTFLNADRGFAVGGENSCSGTGCIPPGGFILQTRDGGQTWNKTFTPSNKLEITSISFISNLNGFCVGDNVIYKTINGRQSWTETQIDNLKSKMMKIKFSSNKTGFIACLFEKILKIMDEGNSWQIISPNKINGDYSLSLVGETGYVSAQGKILKSVDNGNSWMNLKIRLAIYSIYTSPVKTLGMALAMEIIQWRFWPFIRVYVLHR